MRFEHFFRIRHSVSQRSDPLKTDRFISEFNVDLCWLTEHNLMQFSLNVQINFCHYLSQILLLLHFDAT